MADDERISRRTALKVIAVGAATAQQVLAQHPHPHTGVEMVPPAGPINAEMRFFSPAEIDAVTMISELIIPTDEHSPGAIQAGVPAFIDSMVSESSVETKNLWRNGLAAIERLSQKNFARNFTAATEEQQASLLRQISRNEYLPRTIEERFFIAIKGLTVDGYYTSQIGIHQDLRYKGNAYLKDFIGCTHPEHTS